MAYTKEELKTAATNLADALETVGDWVFKATRAAKTAEQKQFVNSAIAALAPMNRDDMDINLRDAYDRFIANPYKELRKKRGGSDLSNLMNDIHQSIIQINTPGNSFSIPSAIDKGYRAKNQQIKAIYKDYVDLVFSISMPFDKLAVAGLAL